MLRGGGCPGTVLDQADGAALESALHKVVDEVESAVFGKGVQEIESKEIGDIVMDKIKDVDQVAYVRFASVYREFKDVNTFIDEIKKLTKWHSTEPPSDTLNEDPAENAKLFNYPEIVVIDLDLCPNYNLWSNDINII